MGFAGYEPSTESRMTSVECLGATSHRDDASLFSLPHRHGLGKVSRHLRNGLLQCASEVELDANAIATRWPGR